MFGSTHNGAKAYASVGVETGVTAANPHKLIVMLFEGALIAVSTALHCMKAKDIAGKAKAISKAISIIDNGLRASLNKKVGGQVAENLDALYEYLSNRLITANVNNQPEILEEVQRLLLDLKSAWDAIGVPVPNASVQSIAQPEATVKKSAYATLEPTTSRLVKA